MLPGTCVQRDAHFQLDERAQAANLLLQACEERRVEAALLGHFL